MLKKVKGYSWIHPFVRICSHILRVVSQSMSHPYIMYCGNLISSFCTILLTNEQTARGGNITSLEEIIINTKEDRYIGFPVTMECIW